MAVFDLISIAFFKHTVILALITIDFQVCARTLSATIRLHDITIGFGSPHLMEESQPASQSGSITFQQNIRVAYLPNPLIGCMTKGI